MAPRTNGFLEECQHISDVTITFHSAPQTCEWRNQDEISRWIQNGHNVKARSLYVLLMLHGFVLESFFLISPSRSEAYPSKEEDFS